MSKLWLLLFFLVAVVPLASAEPSRAKPGPAAHSVPSPDPPPASADKTVAAPSNTELFCEMSLGAGTVFPWDAMDETGNAVNLGLGIAWDGLRVGVSYAGVLPDSRAQGLYHTLGVDFTWFMVDSMFGLPLRPYALVAAGVALADAPPVLRIGDPAHVRWNEATAAFGQVALGLRYGAPTGLFVAAEFRATNFRLGGVNAWAGLRF
jgi:hypothetical protein